MSWRYDEVWLDTDLHWFRDQQRRPFATVALAMPSYGIEQPPFLPIPTGLEASRRRRLAKQAARRRRLATRTVPAVALVLGSAAMLPIYAVRYGSRHDGGRLLEDPPSLTFRLRQPGLAFPEAPVPRRDAFARAPVSVSEFPKIEWHNATSIGLPYSGYLTDGTQLPIEGADWVTWNPATDSVPNLPGRLYGHERTIRTTLAVIAAYRAVFPEAPRVVLGDISFRGGGSMDEHVSHQNGLDVDVYYPRRDRHLSAPATPSQVDHRRAQDLLDRFVAAGAQVVFVGYSTGLSGPNGVVVPYPNHENHMHVRFPTPPG
jgi:hypothetical protein